MRHLTPLFVLAALIFGTAGQCRAETADHVAPESSPAFEQADPAPGIEEWRRRVEQARVRAAAARALARSGVGQQGLPTAEEMAATRSEWVLQDQSLVRGDIVSTKDGLFVFRGEDAAGTGERSFVPVEVPRSAP